MNKICGTGLEESPHGDTLNYLMCNLETNQLSRFRARMIERLLRSRCLEKFRLFGRYYLIVFDATCIHVFKERHCEHCLRRKDSCGKYYYYHCVVEAKLVCKNGMLLSLGTEFVENEHSDVDKQDCELRAAYRLMEKLKKDFPRLPICFLGDSLYANQTVFRYCERYNWQWIINFKPGSIPNVHKEFLSLLPVAPENRLICNDQRFLWIDDIDHEGHKINLLACAEPDPKKPEGIRNFTWATSFNINPYNVTALANEGGRLRWKIENEGFNTQKNEGFGLEHLYGEYYNAMKNYYLLMQSAHIIYQLIEFGWYSKIQLDDNFGSIKNLVRNILHSLLYELIVWDEMEARSMQVRFLLDSS